MPHSTLQPGDQAPSFGTWADNGKTYTAQDAIGKWVALYFYPKDNTSGCTQEAREFKELYPSFSHKNCLILGISKDSPASHKKFQDALTLPFPLISDSSGEICEAYGTWVEKSLYGRKYFGIERSTFLLDPHQKITHIWRKVKVPSHAQKVLETLHSALQN